MKAQILKIAGVKSEKEFYKKYPSEEAFMKKHGKEFKKAQMGTMISGGDKMSNPKILGLKDFYDDVDLTVTGMTDEMREKKAAEAAKAAASADGGGGGGIGSILGMLGGGEGGEGGLMSMLGGGGGEGAASAASMLGGARYGADIPRAQFGGNFPPPIDSSLEGSPEYQEQQSNMNIPTPTNTSGGGLEGALGSISKYAGPAGQLFQGYQALRAERRARKDAEQQKVVSDITLKASQTRPEEIKRKYVRPEDIENTGEEFFPIYGVGTNVLARNGARLQDGGMVVGNPTEIQNTYGDGNSIYDDLGYVPLIDVDQQKSFRQGGRLYQLQSGGSAGGGADWGAISGLATNMGQTAMGGQNAGGQIGSTIGSTAGTLIGGPIGGAIGGFVGGIAGNALDTNAKRTKKYQHETQRNIKKMALNSGFQSVNAGNASYVRDGGDIPNYEDGGYMNPEYNPQVITMFGDVNSQDFADFAHKDEFRAGGHLKAYTPPSERAMETYEDGGDVTSYGLGGELQTYWGGYAEPMSYNPYLPGTGETVMFRGKSHEERSPNGETGIGVTYGGNPVEVERGEPMVELEDGGTVDPETGEVQKSGVVFGNLKIPNQYLDLLGDPKAKGKKFKNYVADLSKIEEKQNKMIEKSTNELNALDINSSFDRLKLSSLQANIEGGNLKLKEIADKKINAASLQNAINDTAEEYGIVADDLAKGKVKIDKEAMSTRQARLGAAISKAKDGVTTTTEQTTKSPFTKFSDPEKAKAAGFVQNANGLWYKPKEGKAKTVKEKKSASAMDNIPKQSVDKATGLFGGITPEQFEAYKKKNSWFTKWDTFDPTDQNDVDEYAKAFNTEAEKRGSKARILPDVEYDPKTKKSVPGTKTKYVGKQFTSANIEDVREEEPAIEDQELAIIDEPNTQPIPYKRSPWIDIGNQVLDYIRPTDQEAFDIAQIYPEMYAMSSNQLEPVPTQGYQPELGVPYDISLQDQLNANQADYRAMQRVVGYNPAAQANLNAQKYQANQQVLGTQFRANQEMKDRVYGENRNILNQAKLTNLGIYDKQYERQAEALSNTKATTQAALNSISDKMAKNKLENRTLGIYENLYKYRYDKSGRAINMNGIFQPNIPTVGGVNATQKQVPVLDENGNVKYYQLQNKTKEEIAAEEEEDYKAVPPLSTGGINGNVQTKTKKRNGSIVKAIKNL